MRTLFDPQARPRWTGSRALVPVDRESCPTCLSPLTEITVTETALFVHGGYGASRATTSVSCERCTWSLVVAVSEVRPDRKVAA